MGGTNPVVLVALLTAVSLVVTIFKYHDAPDKVPLWWDLNAQPMLWVPRWLGLFLLPVLTFLVPYVLYQTVVHSNLESHGYESKHSIFHMITLPAIFLFITQTFVLLPAAMPAESFPARTFVANVALWLLLWFGHIVKHVEPNRVVGVVNPWTGPGAAWDSLHRQAGLIFEVAGVILFVLAFVLPLGWPLAVGLGVLWLGPWIVAYALAFSKGGNSSEKEPLVSA